MYNQALRLASQKVDNESIRKQTHWFQDKNGDWKFEFSDKDMQLKKFLHENSKYKLGDILEHSVLFELYPELRDYSIKTENMQSNGSHVAKRKTIYINNNLLGSNKNIEKTLIHEIQHAIQNIEHFEGGGSTRTSKLAYYNKLGEIEATDVSNRFETEKYQKKDVSLISPESSKENPKHKNLNDYLKNRGIIDKIKDKAYNTVKEFFNNESRKYDESFEENIGQSDRETTDLVVGRRRYIKKDGRKKLIKDATKELENNSSSFSLPKNEKLSQNKLGRWESFLERNKINKGTTTTLGELRLPEAKRNLPAVKEIQFKDSVNNARYISKEKEVKMILILIKNWNKKVHIFII